MKIKLNWKYSSITGQWDTFHFRVIESEEDINEIVNDYLVDEGYSYNYTREL